MNIQDEIFKRSKINYNKLLKYGFIKEKDNYILETNIDNSFKVIITINNNISYKIIDLDTNLEYLQIKTNSEGEFVSNLRNKIKELLLDIKNNCFDLNYYIYDQTNRINNYIKEKYNDEPEFLWEKYPGFGIYRNKFNNKWYAAIMNIDYSKIDNKKGEIEIINIKLDRNKIKDLLKEKGFYKAYHMNKQDWISIILNDTLKDNKITKLIDESYKIIENI